MKYVAGKRARSQGESPLTVPTSPLAATARFKPALDFLTALAVLAIPYVAVRVLIEAHFNLDVAVALAVATDPVRLVLTALLLIMPILFGAGGVVCAFHGARKAHRLSKGKLKTYLLWFAAAIALSVPIQLANSAGDLPTALIHLCILILALEAGRFIDVVVPPFPGRSDAKAYAEWEAATIAHENARGMYRFAPLYLGLAIIALGLAGPMWLPAERVVIEEKPHLVYFLSVQDDEAVLFVPDRNAVQRFALKDLSERQFCRVGKFDTLGEAIFGGTEGLPTCP